MGSKKQLRRALAQAEAALKQAGVDWRPNGADPAVAERLAQSTPPVRLGVALAMMKRAADDADRQGDTIKADGLRREIATIKLQVAEKHRQQTHEPSRLGPGAVELFSRTGTLGPDEQVGGI